MAAGGVIAEFLASVGFKADEKSLKSSLAKVAAFGAGIQVVALGIYAGITKVAQGEAALSRQAEKLGTTSDTLQELGYVAEQSGSSLDAVTSSMESLVAKNPRIKDAAKALEVAGDRMQRMNEVQQKAYAARMGIDPSLIPALTKDASALKDEFRQMYAVAGYDAKEAGKASKEFMGEIGKLATMAGLLAKGVSLAFIGKIRHDIENLRRVVMENFAKIKRVFEMVIAVVLRISAVISAALYRVIKVISGLVGWFDSLADGQKKLVFGAAALLTAWKVLNAGFLATPLGAIIAGLVAIVALVDDYLTYMEGGRSYFNWGPWEKTITAVVAALKPLVSLVMAIGQGIVAAIFPALDGVVTGIGRIISWIVLWGRYFLALFSGDATLAAALGKQLFTGLADIVVGIFSTLVETLTAFFRTLWGGVAEAFPDFAGWAGDAADSITGAFGKAVAWVKEKLAGLTAMLPDWVKEKMGLTVQLPGDAPVPSGPGTAPPPPGRPEAPPLTRVQEIAQGASGAVIRPGAAQAAAMKTEQKTVTMNAKTEIHMHTADPVAAGNQVAARQVEVNAEVARNTRGIAW